MCLARIFAELRKAIERGDVADPVTLKAAFDLDPALEEKGGARYLVQLVQAGMYRRDRIEIELLARIIYESWLQRELIALLEEHSTVAWRCAANDPPMEQIVRLEAALCRLAESGQPGAGFKSFGATMQQILASAQEAYKSGGNMAGVLTGFADLDKMLGGLHSSDLVILAARPSMGKSALAENIARNVTKAGQVTGFYSLEMSRADLGARTMAGEAGVPADWLRRAAETFNLHVDKLNAVNSRHAALPFYIDEESALSVATMHSRARRLKRQHGLELIITDYLQLATASRPEGRVQQNRALEVGEISGGLKRIAKDLEIPVLALSQLNRRTEDRGKDKRPQLSDLRESGAIEQDADVVLLLFREEYYHPENEDVQGKAEVIVAKNRHGPTGTVNLYFDSRTTQFSNLALWETGQRGLK
jgi:replicative DNA helicase